MNLENERFYAKVEQKNQQQITESEIDSHNNSISRRISIAENQIRECHWEKFDGYLDTVKRIEERIKQLNLEYK